MTVSSHCIGEKTEILVKQFFHNHNIVSSELKCEPQVSGPQTHAVNQHTLYRVLRWYNLKQSFSVYNCRVLESELENLKILES